LKGTAAREARIAVWRDYLDEHRSRNQVKFKRRSRRAYRGCEMGKGITFQLT
jgi:hypothetical protein